MAICVVYGHSMADQRAKEISPELTSSQELDDSSEAGLFRQPRFILGVCYLSLLAIFTRAHVPKIIRIDLYT